MPVNANPSALRPRHHAPVQLGAVLARVRAARPGVEFDFVPADAAAALDVSGAASDSRLVGPGDLYLALPGGHTHGARFAGAAAKAGAVAILTDNAGAALLSGSEPGSGSRLPVVVVSDPRAVMAPLAAEIYGRPAEQLQMVGVTGTNGKTTVSYLVDAGLRAAGWSAGLIGTLGYALDGVLLPGMRTTITTPESAELQGLLAALVEGGATAVTMEVSSHALAVGRVDPIRFAVAAFTNFGRDHLDFHGSLENYFEAKADLFTARRAERAVINLDDPRGAELFARAGAEGLQPVGTSLDPAGDADYRALRMDTRRIDGEGAQTSVLVRTPARTLELRLGLPGRYNVQNAVTALAVLDLLGVDLAAAATGLAQVQVPGRMQRVALGPGAPQVYVDFAHTPQAVGSALAVLRDRAAGGLVCVVGCGGDRDPQKRGPMGAAAVRGADLVLITDDNPRSEDPAAIRAATLAGAEQAIRTERLGAEVVDGGDRRSALRTALRRAAAAPRPAEQVVAVLGKGHEHGQEIAGEIWPFDDAAVVVELWSELASASTPGPSQHPVTA